MTFLPTVETKFPATLFCPFLFYVWTIPTVANVDFLEPLACNPSPLPWLSTGEINALNTVTKFEGGL